MQPKMLFFCELAQGLTQRRVDRLVKRAEVINTHIGKIDNMLFEAASVVWAKMVIADNRQDGGQGG